MFFLIVMFLFMMMVNTESPLKDVSSIVPLVLETRLREQQQIGNTNTVRVMLHILDMMRRIPAEEKVNIGIYESKLRVQLRKYYDESSRLVKGFMERPVNPNEKVSIIEMVLFHIEKSPYMVMFYGTTREKRLLREAIASYRRVCSHSPNTVWEERLAALEEVRKRYQDIKVMKDVMARLPKLDFSLEQGKRGREDVQEIARIALGRIKKIVGKKGPDNTELLEEIEKYLLLEVREVSIAEGHMKKIIQLWERYRAPRIV